MTRELAEQTLNADSDIHAGTSKISCIPMLFDRIQKFLCLTSMLKAKRKEIIHQKVTPYSQGIVGLRTNKFNENKVNQAADMLVETCPPLSRT